MALSSSSAKLASHTNVSVIALYSDLYELVQPFLPIDHSNMTLPSFHTINIVNLSIGSVQYKYQ